MKGSACGLIMNESGDNNGQIYESGQCATRISCERNWVKCFVIFLWRFFYRKNIGISS